MVRKCVSWTLFSAWIPVVYVKSWCAYCIRREYILMLVMAPSFGSIWAGFGYIYEQNVLFILWGDRDG